MSFRDRLTPRTGYRFLVILWILLSVHIAYLYVSFSWDEITDKGGTFIEATTNPVNYLPYTSTNDNDKFYQSLLFMGCLYPKIDGTNITYREELCSVTTEDNQRYTVTTLPGKTWSDGTPITANDILFTYGTILKENYRNIGSLDAFRNVTVTADETGIITVTFPSSSVDNMIFFTNFVLPSHLLGNESLETYVTTFYTSPITSTCITLHNQSRDADSTVFDLSNCSETLLKYYQIKTFASQQSIDTYVKENPGRIDMIINDYPVDGYDENKVILNRFATYFLNTQNPRLTPALRKNITGLLLDAYNVANNNVYVKDQFLFDSIPASDNHTWLSWLQLTAEVVTATANTDEKITLPSLPQNIVFGGSQADEQEYIIEDVIDDKISLQLAFSESFDKISVTLNEGLEYFPSSYNALTQSSLYNLNPVFRNIAQGRNIYTIKGYENDVHTETYTLIIYYLDEPSYPAAETVTTTRTREPFQVIYYTDPTSTAMIDQFQAYLKRNEIDGYFAFNGFGDTNTFEGKLVSQDYDLVLRSINMGLRKDLSSLFESSTPTVNPSGFVNADFAAQINAFFLETNEQQKTRIKARIDELYSENAPLVILWKELGTINIKESLEFPYPQRLYVLWWRRDFINNIDIFQHIRVDRDRVFHIDNMLHFFGQYL